ncbi:hypothetical protein ADUPG1_005592, partial [Aduncisulcus paluster]
DEVAEEATEISESSVDEAAAEDDIDFDLGEAELLAADGVEDGELDADGLDGLIDDLGGDATIAEDDTEDIDSLFDEDSEVENLDSLLEEAGADEDDELDGLLGEVEDKVDLGELGEDVLADEDIEGLLSDDHEEVVELHEEGLELLDDADEEPVIEAAAEVEAVEPEVMEPL